MAEYDAPRKVIVGIGASAGGLEASRQLLASLPEKCGFSLVVLQHLSPDHKSLLPELLQNETALRVSAAADGEPLEPDHVYVVPPDKLLLIEDGRIELTQRPEGHHPHNAPVDALFRSLARSPSCFPVGVVLSGTGSDGAIGLREIRAAGGCAFAQDPQTAKFQGMPQAAIDSGIIDAILSPEEIAQALLRIPHSAAVSSKGVDDGSHEGAVEEEGELGRIFPILLHASGIDFSKYKQGTIRRRIERRMLIHNVRDFERYVTVLQNQPEEAKQLCQDLLIHVTRFFRDREVFEEITARVLPKIVTGSNNGPARIWVVGCATGEEVYSIAMLLLEQMDVKAVQRSIQIFGTDLSQAAIEHARAGIYPETISADVSPDRLSRFFLRREGAFQVNKRLRDLCIFAQQDVTRDPPFSRMDLVLCRNLLIYLGPDLQRRVLKVLYYALQPDGFLVLGASETAGPENDLFTLLDKGRKIYSKRAGLSPRYDLSFSSPDLNRQYPSISAGRPSRARSSVSPADKARQVLLNRYALPGVLIDTNGRVLEIFGETREFLELTPGSGSFDILRIVKEDLRQSVRVAIHEARQERKAIRKDALRIAEGRTGEEVTICIHPIDHQDLLVLFEKTQVMPQQHSNGESEERAPEDFEALADSHTKLRQELAATRAQMQTIVEDLEAANEEAHAANEEITASNEELQSANEELQSTNEELDTAREELQSTNEELHTLNEELAGRNEQLSEANGDLLNLLSSVQSAVLIVNRQLAIRRFTPTAENLFNLLPSDIGRPLTHIKPDLRCDDLEQLVRRTIDNVEPAEREVRDVMGNWYILRVRPYKSLENKIDGAVLALFDITNLKKYEYELRTARDFAEAIVETAREALVVLDRELRIVSANKAFADLTASAREQIVGRLIYQVAEGQWNVGELRPLLEEILPQNSHFENFRLNCQRPRGGVKELILNARRIPGNEGRGDLILLAMENG